LFNRSASQPRFASFVRPDSTSFPMIRQQAVTALVSDILQPYFLK
jgi:hypothetical protein